MSDSDPRFVRLIDFLSLIPAVEADDAPGQGFTVEAGAGSWRVGFPIDVFHDLSWETVQELAHALNTSGSGAAFKPVSPAPDQNGGPDEFLTWVIEAGDALPPDTIADLLKEKLPSPVEDERAWIGDSDEDDSEDADDDADHDDEDIGDGGDY